MEVAMTLMDRVFKRIGLRKEKEIPSNQGIGWRPSEPLLHRLRTAYRNSLDVFVHETNIARMINVNCCLEIGTGMGGTAHYADGLSFRNYTIVNLPTALVGQVFFLAAAHGEHAISLPGENHNAPIKLRAPGWINGTSERFDMVLNVDSITETSEAYAQKYVNFIPSKCRAFLSINHEVDGFTACDLISDLFGKSPCLSMRDGMLRNWH